MQMLQGVQEKFELSLALLGRGEGEGEGYWSSYDVRVMCVVLDSTGFRPRTTSYCLARPERRNY